VPGRVVATVDLRNPDDASMRAAEADVIAYYDEVARLEGVQVSWRQTARTPCVPFDAGLQDHIAAAAEGRGLSLARIVSGAGHDAQEMARITRAAMVFVPGEHDGISHNPRELSTREQCAHGVGVLFDVARRLCDEKDEVTR
ncbi:MAG: M20/M25/M40 family metallo-hydrolase, partial [Myxococcales bacterium]|nr:M20/M25/M40 family metallo-hydrolase [Myxococcales bacterium]